MYTEPGPPGPPSWSICRPGTCRNRSTPLATSRRSICSRPMIVTLSAASRSSVGTRYAVTRTSASLPCAAASAAGATSCAGADGETASRRTRRTGARTGAAHAGQAFAGAPGGQPSPARLPFARLRFRIVCAQLRLPRAPGRPERFATVPRADSPSGLCPRCFGGQRKPGKPMRGAALAAIARATPTVAVRNPPVPRAGSTRPAPSPRGSSCRRARCARSASRRRSPSTRAQRTALR